MALDKNNEWSLGKARLAKAEMLGLGAFSLACIAVSLPGLAIGMAGHMIGNTGGYSITPSLSSKNPREVIGALVGAVGVVFSAPMFLKEWASDRQDKLEKEMDAKMARAGESYKSEAASLARSGKIEELVELLEAFAGGAHPLGKPLAGGIAIELFKIAIARDDGKMMARFLELSGGKIEFMVPGDERSELDLFVVAAKKGAKACCEEMMAIGAFSNIGRAEGPPWRAAEKAGHAALYQVSAKYHSEQLDEGFVKRTARAFKN